MNDNDVSKDERRKEESEMSATLAAVTIVLIVLAIFGAAAAVLAVSAPSAVTDTSWLTSLILASLSLIVGLLARWLRAVLRDNRATRQAIGDVRDEIADLIVRGHQQTQEAIKETREDLADRADEHTDAFTRAALIAQDELDRKRRVMNGHN